MVVNSHVNSVQRVWNGIIAAVGGIVLRLFRSAPHSQFPPSTRRDADSGTGPTNLGFVEITSQELAAEVRTIIHDAQIESTTINPEYGSWNLRVRKGKLDMEYIWLGPDGFGGMDHARPMTPDDTPFDLVDEVFQSVDEALEYLRKLARKYDCTIPPNQPFT